MSYQKLFYRCLMGDDLQMSFRRFLKDALYNLQYLKDTLNLYENLRDVSFV